MGSCHASLQVKLVLYHAQTLDGLVGCGRWTLVTWTCQKTVSEDMETLSGILSRNRSRNGHSDQILLSELVRQMGAVGLAALAAWQTWPEKASWLTLPTCISASIYVPLLRLWSEAH